MRSVRQALATHRMLAVVGGSKIANESRPAVVLRELARHLGEAYFADHAWSLVALQRFELDKKDERENENAKNENTKNETKKEKTIRETQHQIISWHSTIQNSTTVNQTMDNMDTTIQRTVSGGDLRKRIGIHTLSCIYNCLKSISSQTLPNFNQTEISIEGMHRLLIINEMKKWDPHRIDEETTAMERSSSSTTVGGVQMNEETKDGHGRSGTDATLFSSSTVEMIYTILRPVQYYTIHNKNTKSNDDDDRQKEDPFVSIACERLRSLLSSHFTFSFLSSTNMNNSHLNNNMNTINNNNNNNSNNNNNNNNNSSNTESTKFIWYEIASELSIMLKYISRIPSGCILSDYHCWCSDGGLFYEVRRLIVTLCSGMHQHVQEEDDGRMDEDEDDVELLMSYWNDIHFTCMDLALLLTSQLITLSQKCSFSSTNGSNTNTNSNTNTDDVDENENNIHSSYFTLRALVNDSGMNRAIRNYASHSFGVRVSLATEISSYNENEAMEEDILHATEISTNRCLSILSYFQVALKWINNNKKRNKKRRATTFSSSLNDIEQQYYTPYQIQRIVWWLLNPTNGLIFDSLLLLNAEDEQEHQEDQEDQEPMKFNNRKDRTNVLRSKIYSIVNSFYRSGVGALVLGQKNGKAKIYTRENATYFIFKGKRCVVCLFVIVPCCDSFFFFKQPF